jgi:nucleoside phosphorylase
VIEAPVDFAIVAALPVEREALVRRLEGVERVQPDGEPLTFYVGTVSVPGEGKPFTVVVTQLLDMGNTDASITTTRVIQRWRPRNVLMVGIAGGVEGKAALGDVAVAQYAYYFEPAKLAAEGIEHRGRQFNSDLLLYGRVQHYEAAEWKGEIHAARPDTAGGEPKLPEVRFGPIACGDKVVANLEELAEIRRQCPKMIAVAMEGAGVAKAVLSEGSPVRYLEIRGISDYAGPDKHDGWHEYAANAAAAFCIGFLRSRPFSPGPPPEQIAGQAKPVATLVLIAQSLRLISVEEVVAALDEDTKRGELEFLHLDFTDLVRNRVFTDPEAAARRLVDPQGPLLGALARCADARLAFCGLAAIPPVVLAGHIVTDRRFVRLLDFHPEPGNWSWPGTSNGFPTLQCRGMPKRSLKEPGDAVLRMAVSYPVAVESIRNLGLAPKSEIDLSLPAPTRSIVQSEDQVRDYGRAFREVLDRLSGVMPSTGRVHLFYAGPMALAFHLGQQISENIHPPVVVWNYSRGYEWALDLRAAVSGEPCILRPAGP